MDNELFEEYINTLTDEEIGYKTVGELIRRAKIYHGITD